MKFFDWLKVFFFGMPEKRLKLLFFLAQMLRRNGYIKLSNQLNYKIQHTYGCYISLNAKINQKVEFRHPVGIVIGDGVILEEGVIVYQGVTLGGKKIGEKVRAYPHIKKNCILYAGSKVLGNVVVGEGSSVGAGSIVLNDVTPHSIVTGSPATLMKKIS